MAVRTGSGWDGAPSSSCRGPWPSAWAWRLAGGSGRRPARSAGAWRPAGGTRRAPCPWPCAWLRAWRRPWFWPWPWPWPRRRPPPAAARAAARRVRRRRRRGVAGSLPRQRRDASRRGGAGGWGSGREVAAGSSGGGGIRGIWHHPTGRHPIAGTLGVSGATAIDAEDHRGRGGIRRRSGPGSARGRSAAVGWWRIPLRTWPGGGPGSAFPEEEDRFGFPAPGRSSSPPRAPRAAAARSGARRGGARGGGGGGAAWVGVGAPGRARRPLRRARTWGPGPRASSGGEVAPRLPPPGALSPIAGWDSAEAAVERVLVLEGEGDVTTSGDGAQERGLRTFQLFQFFVVPVTRPSPRSASAGDPGSRLA